MEVATVGMFDGVHRGHRALIGELAAIGCRQGLAPCVLTFADHPLRTIDPGRAPERIATRQRRGQLLLEAGAAAVRELDFGAIRSLAGADFLRRLHSGGTAMLLMGFNNHIGRDRLSAAQAAALNIMPVVELPREDCPEGVSSSAVRAALRQGEVGTAADMLGRLYSVEGTVAAGKGLGHTLGFPTANIEGVATMLPADGVYAVDVRVDGGTARRGMANIGTRPTFDDGDRRTLEVNIFDFDSTIYGHSVEVAFVGRLRPERRFGDAEELRRALEADRVAAMNTPYPLIS